jgi:paraquat-inducible protein B
MVDQSVANDFFAPQNNMPTPEPKITPEEPTITIQNTPNEEVAQADFQNMINNEISKIPQQPNDQPIQPKVDETPSSELPQVPPTM